LRDVRVSYNERLGKSPWDLEIMKYGFKNKEKFFLHSTTHKNEAKFSEESYLLPVETVPHH
jgi:hypothetical protein